MISAVDLQALLPVLRRTVVVALLCSATFLWNWLSLPDQNLPDALPLQDVNSSYVSPDQSMDEYEKRHAALLLVGAARSLMWPAVCRNIKERLVDALSGPARNASWKAHVFLFLTLEETDAKALSKRSQHKYTPSQLKFCSNLLEAKHVELMPASYPLPLFTKNCQPGKEPVYVNFSAIWNLSGASERMYSQCKRIQVAYDFIQQEYEPKVGVKYAVMIRARPHSVYLRPVPSLEHFNISRYTVAAGALEDHWHLVHRGCTGPAVRDCLKCKGEEFDEDCPPEPFDRDTLVNPVVVREINEKYAKYLKMHVPKRPKQFRHYGVLYLECFRCKGHMQSKFPAQYKNDTGFCDRQQKIYLESALPAIGHFVA